MQDNVGGHIVRTRTKSQNNLLKNRSSTLRYELSKSLTQVSQVPDVNLDLRKSLLALDGTCEYCRTNEAVAFDHFNPMVKKGFPTGYCNDLWNMVPACSRCNSSKGNTDCLIWLKGSAKKNPCRNMGAEDRDKIFQKWEAYAKACDEHCVKAKIDIDMFKRLNILILMQLTALQKHIDEYSQDFRISDRQMIFGERSGEQIREKIDQEIDALEKIQGLTLDAVVNETTTSSSPTSPVSQSVTHMQGTLPSRCTTKKKKANYKLSTDTKRDLVTSTAKIKSSLLSVARSQETSRRQGCSDVSSIDISKDCVTTVSPTVKTSQKGPLKGQVKGRSPHKNKRVECRVQDVADHGDSLPLTKSTHASSVPAPKNGDKISLVTLPKIEEEEYPPSSQPEESVASTNSAAVDEDDASSQLSSPPKTSTKTKHREQVPTSRPRAISHPSIRDTQVRPA